MDNTGKAIIVLGIAGLTGAAIHSGIEHHRNEKEAIKSRQNALEISVENQEEKIKRLERDIERLTTENR